MPLFVIAIGIVLILSAWRNRQRELGMLLIGDFTGPNNYLVWLGVLVLVYLLSKIEPSGRIGKGMMVLVILAIMLRSGSGFFDMLTKQLNEIQSQKVAQ